MGIYVFKYDVIEAGAGRRHFAAGFRQRSNSRQHQPATTCRLTCSTATGKTSGRLRAFYKANLDMTSAIPPFNLFDAEAPMFTRARYLPPSKIDNCEIRDSIISDGCIINGAKINRSVIGSARRIGEGAHLDAAYMMGADYYQTIEDMLGDREAQPAAHRHRGERRSSGARSSTRMRASASNVRC